jgi:hypothetical protein
MLHNGRQRHLQRLRQLTHRSRPTRQPLHHPPPRRIRQSLKNPPHRIHRLLKHPLNHRAPHTPKSSPHLTICTQPVRPTTTAGEDASAWRRAASERTFRTDHGKDSDRCATTPAIRDVLNQERRSAAIDRRGRQRWRRNGEKARGPSRTDCGEERTESRHRDDSQRSQPREMRCSGGSTRPAAVAALRREGAWAEGARGQEMARRRSQAQTSPEVMARPSEVKAGVRRSEAKAAAVVGRGGVPVASRRRVSAMARRSGA